MAAAEEFPGPSGRDSSVSPPFAMMTALHTLGILSISFMRLSPGWFSINKSCK